MDSTSFRELRLPVKFLFLCVVAAALFAPFSIYAAFASSLPARGALAIMEGTFAGWLLFATLRRIQLAWWLLIVVSALTIVVTGIYLLTVPRFAGFEQDLLALALGRLIYPGLCIALLMTRGARRHFHIPVRERVRSRRLAKPRAVAVR
jgi:hypothetical protein